MKLQLRVLQEPQRSSWPRPLHTKRLASCSNPDKSQRLDGNPGRVALTPPTPLDARHLPRLGREREGDAETEVRRPRSASGHPQRLSPARVVAVAQQQADGDGTGLKSKNEKKSPSFSRIKQNVQL